ncbi:MAG: hypothetical protein LBO81_02200, partial [Clostridiales Family XIII bacterium]|nr:hypothetical protein [Clostridiales Family XIII bacterium]
GSGDGSGGDGNNAGSGKHVQSAGIGAKNVENRAPAGERMGKARETNAATVAEPPAANAAEERLRKKREETERRRIEKKRAALEAEIGRLETAFAAAQADIGKEGICADPGKLARKAKELDELTRALDAAYAQWCEL